MKKFLLTASVLALTASPAFAGPATGSPGAFGGTEGGVNTKQYHSYDGLICTDCHTLHNSEDGAKVTIAGYTETLGGYRELLYRGDWTDMCLSCHKQGQNTSSTAALPSVTDSGWVAPIVMTTGTSTANSLGISMPGGDFKWSAADPKKGHNPAFTKGSMGTATSLFMPADATLGSTPPGGSITDGEWSCHSCHGMHARFSGSYTAYRQLKRKVNGKVVTGNVSTFGVETAAGGETQDASYEPILSNSRGDIQADVNGKLTVYVNTRKDGKPLEGADLTLPYEDTNKNVYRGGFSSFCAACHGDFHGTTVSEGGGADNTQSASGVWYKHPTNLEMAQPVSTRKYGINTYKAVITNQQNKNPNPPGYDFRYPLIQPSVTGGAVLDTETNAFIVKAAVASANDPTTLLPTQRLSCLTCHKAHASEFDNMVRFDASAHAFIAEGAADVDGITYDPTAGTFIAAGSLGDNPAFGCGKCHQKGGTAAFVKSW